MQGWRSPGEEGCWRVEEEGMLEGGGGWRFESSWPTGE